MKTVFIGIACFFLGIAFQHNYATTRLKEREAQAGFLSEMRGTAASGAPAAKTAEPVIPPRHPARPGRTWTYMPQLDRWIEHDSDVSAMRSIGGG